MPVALVHGLVITLAALILLGLSWNQPWMAFSLLAGILLLGPVLAVGVNYLALQKERGEPGGSGLGWLGPMGGSIWAFAALLALIVIFPWLGFSMWHAYRDLVDVR